MGGVGGVGVGGRHAWVHGWGVCVLGGGAHARVPPAPVPPRHAAPQSATESEPKEWRNKRRRRGGSPAGPPPPPCPGMDRPRPPRSQTAGRTGAPPAPRPGMVLFVCLIVGCVCVCGGGDSKRCKGSHGLAKAKPKAGRAADGVAAAAAASLRRRCPPSSTHTQTHRLQQQAHARAHLVVDQVVVHGAHGQQRRDRDAVGARLPV